MKNENKTETILIVDDNPDSLEVLSRILSGYGYQVRTAPNGEQGLKSAAEAPPDLVLLDVMMPDMDGYQVCARLKADPRTAEVPVVFLSALKATPDKVKGFEAGGVDFISKPFQAEEVYARVKTHLEISRLRRRLEAQNSDLLSANERLAAEMAERMNAQKKLETEHSLLSALINSPEDLIVFSLDTGYCYTAFNEKHRVEMKKVWNAEIEIGMNLLGIMSMPDVRALAQQSIDRARSGEAFTEHQHQPGTQIYYELRWNPIFHDKEIIGVSVFIRDISAQKLAEEKLREKDFLLRESQTVARLGAYSYDFTKGRWTSSEMLDEIFGIGDSYIRSVEGWAAIIHPEDRESMVAYLNDEVIGKRIPFNREYRIVRINDSAERWVHGMGKLEFDDKGEPVRLLGTIQDVTDRVQSENALQNAYRNWQTTFDGIKDAIFLLNPDGLIMQTNQASLSLFAGKGEMLTGRHCWEVVHHSTEHIQGCPFVRMKESRERESMELKINDKWYEVVVDPILNVRNEITGAVHIVSDMTQRKLTEEALKKSEAKFRNVFEHAAVGKSLTEIGGNMHTNPAFRNIIGYTEEELKHINWQEITHPEHIKADLEMVNSLLSGERTSAHWKKRYIHKNGNVIWADVLTVLQRDYAGKPEYFITTIYDITDQVRLQEELRETNEYLGNLITYANAPIMVWDKEQRITRFNKAFEELSGYSSSEVLGRRLHFLFPEKTAESSLELINSTVAGTRWDSVEIEIQTKDNQVRTVLWNSANILGSDGKSIVATIAQGQDITARKAIEQNLLETNARLDAFMEFVPALILIKDSELRPVYANGNLRALFPIDEWMGKKPFELFPPSVAEEMVEKDMEAMEKNYVSYEETWKDRHGETRIFFTEKFRINVPGKEPLLGAIISDITERKRTEEELLESEERFRRAVLEAPIPMLIHDEDDRNYQISKGWTHFSQYTIEDIPTLGDWTKLAYGERSRFAKEYIDRLFLINETVSNGEWNVTTKDGNARIWDFYTTPLGKSREGKRLLLSLAIDITDRKKTENNLKESEAKFRQTFDNSPLGIVLVGLDRKFILCNNAFSLMLGYEPGDLPGKTIDQITYPEDVTIGKAEMKAIVEGKLGQAVVLKRYQRNDGKIVWGGVTITLVRDSKDIPLYFLAIIQDITEKKRADEKILNQLEELKRWQKVTSGREDRVRELKQEINELLIRAGQPVRYTVQKLESSGNQ